MDPVTALVVSAIAAGAAAGMTDTASQLVNDAYTGLKNLLSRKYSDVDIAGVERKPESDAKKASLAEDLDDAGAAGDRELGSAAAALLEAVREHDPQVVIGVDVTGLVAAALTISDVVSTGDGARISDSRIEGEVDIRGIRAGSQQPPHPESARD